MTKRIIGRVREIAMLERIFQSNLAEFIALYGRRRVGKTFLIKNFFETKSCIFFYVSRIKDGYASLQIEEFIKQIGLAFYDDLALAPRARWKDAFEDLNIAISRQPINKKVALFFDELPWMATPRSRLLQQLRLLLESILVARYSG